MTNDDKVFNRVAINSGSAGDLKCPHCKGEHLHQEEVEVYWRDHEDGPATKITSSGAEVSVTRDDDAPGRRQSTFIWFVCEDCSGGGAPLLKFCLEIQQYQGRTRVNWIDFKGEFGP